MSFEQLRATCTREQLQVINRSPVVLILSRLGDAIPSDLMSPWPRVASWLK